MRIDSQLPGYRELARRALAWITYAQRTLTTVELCHALAIELGTNDLDPDNICDIDDVLSVWVGLVMVDKESNRVRLVHYTAQEYLERIRSEWIPEGQKNVAEACLTWLSFDGLRYGSGEIEARDYNAKADVKKSATLDAYITLRWDRHIRPVQADVASLAVPLLQDLGFVQYIAESSMALQSSPTTFVAQCTGLHITAWYGLLYLTAKLLQAGCVDLDVKSSDGSTALSLAIQRGQEEVIKLLLQDENVEADSCDWFRRTPLSHAAKRGDQTLVQLLMTRDDVDINTRDIYGWSPLSYAAIGGYEAVVKLLLARNTLAINRIDDHGRTPLFYAAMRGNEAVVKLLISHDDVGLSLKDGSGKTALWYATRHDHKSVARLLVSSDCVWANVEES